MRSFLPLGAAALALALAGCSAPTPTPVVTVASPSPPAAPTSVTVAVVTPRVAESRELVDDVVAALRTRMMSTGGTVRVYAAAGDVTPAQAIDAALADDPALVVGIGPGVVSDLDHAAATNLDHRFLAVDAQSDEPTDNMSALVFRDYEALYLEGVESAAARHPAVVAPDLELSPRAGSAPFVAGAASASVEVAVRTAAQDTPDAAAAAARTAAAAGADLVGLARFPRDVDLVDAGLHADVFGVGADRCAAAAGHVVDSLVIDPDAVLVTAVDRILAGDAGAVYSAGVAEGAVRLAGLDGDEACLITSDPVALARARAAFEAIASGATVVPDPTLAG